MRSVTTTPAATMKKAALVKETSMPPKCSGTQRSMVNWWRGFACSAATSILVLVRPTRVLGVLGLTGLAALRSHRHAHSGHGAIDIPHAGAEAEEEQHDHPPRPRAEPLVERPADADADAHGHHQLQANPEGEAERVPIGGGPVIIGAGIPSRLPAAARLVEPFSQVPEGILTVAFVHRRTARKAQENSPHGPGRLGAETARTIGAGSRSVKAVSTPKSGSFERKTPAARMPSDEAEGGPHGRSLAEQPASLPVGIGRIGDGSDVECLRRARRGSGRRLDRESGEGQGGHRQRGSDARAWRAAPRASRLSPDRGEAPDRRGIVGAGGAAQSDRHAVSPLWRGLSRAEARGALYLPDPRPAGRRQCDARQCSAGAA